MLNDRDIKQLLRFNDGRFSPPNPDPSVCGWCEKGLAGEPAAIPLGGEARFFKSEECHPQCFDDMLEDWKKAGQWKGLRSYKSKMAPRRGIHLVLAAIWK